MFSAIGRLLKALGYLVTGRLDKFSETLRSNPAVMKAEYAQVIKDKKDRAMDMMNAISRLVALQENRKQKIATLTKEINDLSKKKDGAAALAKKIAVEAGGPEAAANHPELGHKFKEARQYFENFSSTIKSKEETIASEEAAYDESQDNVEKFKTSLKILSKEINDLKEEQAEAVAELISAKEQAAINQALTGIGDDKTADQLSALRQARADAKAKAKVSSELAGLDHKTDEAKFMELAESAAANEEFDALFETAKAETSETTSEFDKAVQIPES